MKLDVNALRYLSKEDFRVLTAVEMGQKNHELVPMQLIDTISGIKHGGAFRSLKTLLQHKLVHHEGQKYDGYRLTYMGYDFLAIKALVARGHISGVGRQIGVGKESDIFEVTNDEGEVFALKLHRLGRTSFRAVKSKRDYLAGRSSFSWLYLSRLAALKEFAFMKALGDHGFPVPAAIDNNRHAVLMELVDAQPLVQVRELGHPHLVYSQAMELIHRLAGCGLVHCDFNEFNLLVHEDERLTLIDFPQMVSVSHANAEELFERDVECIVRFFNKKIGYMPQHDPSLPRVRPSFAEAAAEAAAAGASGLDVELAASGFQRQHQAVLEDFAAAAEGSSDAGSHGSGEEADSDASCSEDGAAEASADTAAAAAGQLAERLASGAACSSRPAAAAAANSRQAAPPRVPASMQQWLEQHVEEHTELPEAPVGGSGSSSRSECGADDSSSGGSDAGAESAAAADSPQQQQAQQQQQWGRASVAPSRAPTDLSFMGREVQQRVVAQRQRATAAARAAKSSRNVTKARGRKDKEAKAAIAEW